MLIYCGQYIQTYIHFFEHPQSENSNKFYDKSGGDLGTYLILFYFKLPDICIFLSIFFFIKIFVQLLIKITYVFWYNFSIFCFVIFSFVSKNKDLRDQKELNESKYTLFTYTLVQHHHQQAAHHRHE